MVAAVLCLRCSRVGPVRGCPRCAEVRKEKPVTKVKDLEYHPLANLFPLIEGAEFEEFADDIAANGQRDVIWKYEGKILDGRNRWRACRARDIDPRIEEYRGKDPLGFVISKNLTRRHLTTSQRAMVAAELASLKQGGDRRSDQVLNFGLETQDAAAAVLNVSPGSVQNAAKVIEKGVPGLAEAVKAGEVSVGAAAVIASLPEKEQKAAVKGGAAKIKETAAAARKRKQREAVMGRRDQPVIPRTVPTPKPATKKCRPRDPDALFALESAEWCRDQLEEVGRRMDDLARGPFARTILDQHQWFEDPEPVFLREKKAQDPDARRGVVDVYTCSALACLEVLFISVARDLIDEHGTDEPVEEEIDV